MIAPLKVDRAQCLLFPACAVTAQRGRLALSCKVASRSVLGDVIASSAMHDTRSTTSCGVTSSWRWAQRRVAECGLRAAPDTAVLPTTDMCLASPAAAAMRAARVRLHIRVRHVVKSGCSPVAHRAHGVTLAWTHLTCTLAQVLPALEHCQKN